jgi:hypothetical protein
MIPVNQMLIIPQVNQVVLFVMVNSIVHPNFDPNSSPPNYNRIYEYQSPNLFTLPPLNNQIMAGILLSFALLPLLASQP